MRLFGQSLITLEGDNMNDTIKSLWTLAIEISKTECPDCESSDLTYFIGNKSTSKNIKVQNIINDLENDEYLLVCQECNSVFIQWLTK